MNPPKICARPIRADARSEPARSDPESQGVSTSQTVPNLPVDIGPWVWVEVSGHAGSSVVGYEDTNTGYGCV